MTEVGSTYSIKYKTMTTTIIVVPCPSSLSWSPVVSLHRLCPFVGAGRRLWAVVGGGRGPWFVFWVAAVFVLAIICVHFGEFVIVSGQS